MDINKPQTAPDISNDYPAFFAYAEAQENQAYCFCHTRCQGLCSINY